MMSLQSGLLRLQRGSVPEPETQAYLGGNQMIKAIITSLLGALLSMAVFHFAMAHGGGTDGNGCHHDYKRGGYHCH